MQKSDRGYLSAFSSKKSKLKNEPNDLMIISRLSANMTNMTQSKNFSNFDFIPFVPPPLRAFLHPSFHASAQLHARRLLDALFPAPLEPEVRLRTLCSKI